MDIQEEKEEEGAHSGEGAHPGEGHGPLSFAALVRRRESVLRDSMDERAAILQALGQVSGGNVFHVCVERGAGDRGGGSEGQG